MKRLLELVKGSSKAVQLPEKSQLNVHNYYNPWNRVFLYTAFAFVLFGIKLWFIGTYGNAIPFWDQWDAEADHLYKPFLKGTLHWTDLFSPHNEHRIFTTRLLALSLLTVNKTWNPLLQMVVNATLHIILLIYTIRLLTRVIGQHYLAALLLFTLILFGIPFGWENLLTGFQSPFYFVLLFSMVALWLLLTRAPLSKGWSAGIVFAMLSFFSLASGILTFASAAVISSIIYVAVRRSSKQLIASIILIALTALCFSLTSSEGGAKSFSTFYNALTSIFGWPVSQNLFSAVVRNLPALIFSVIILYKRPSATDYNWFLLGLIVLSCGQAISIGYGRPDGSLSSRYLDLFTFSILVNFVCLISIAKSFIQTHRIATVAGVFAWSSIIIICLGLYAGEKLPPELDHKRSASITQVNNTQNYLITGNYDFIKDKPYLEIPYPSSERLATLLAIPEIRKILPFNLSLPEPVSTIKSLPAGAFIPNGYYQSVPKRTDNTWGSYSAHGNDATGELSIQFNNTSPGSITIPVAGYPLRDGIKLEVEQHGRRKPVRIKNDPAESWGTGYASVDKGQFSIRVTDSSTTVWLAVGCPSFVGKFDAIINDLLKNYYVAIMIGLLVLFWGLIYNGLLLKPRNDENISNF